MNDMLMAIAKWDTRNIKKGEKVLIEYFNTEIVSAPMCLYGHRGTYRCNDFILADGSSIPKDTYYKTTINDKSDDIKFVTCRSDSFKYLVKGETYRVLSIRERYDITKVFLATEKDRRWYQIGKNITRATPDEVVRFKIRELKVKMDTVRDIYRDEEFRPTQDSTRTDYQCQDNDREVRSVLS